MKVVLLNIFLILLNLNCSTNGQIIDTTVSNSKNDLIFKSTIISEKLKTEVLVYDQGILSDRKELLIELKKENEIIFSDTLSIELVEEPIIELRDINGDKIEDLSIEYLRPGRGVNMVSMIYIFNENKIGLNRISNSILFPNLGYDDNLNFISSVRFSGGDYIQMDYLKIENELLEPKFRVIKEDQKVYIQKFQKDNWIELEIRTLENDIIVPEIIQLEPEIKVKNAS